jgi:hypothetical protein
VVSHLSVLLDSFDFVDSVEQAPLLVLFALEVVAVESLFLFLLPVALVLV